jgi:hypothetical protein
MGRLQHVKEAHVVLGLLLIRAEVEGAEHHVNLASGNSHSTVLELVLDESIKSVLSSEANLDLSEVEGNLELVGLGIIDLLQAASALLF